MENFSNLDMALENNEILQLVKMANPNALPGATMPDKDFNFLDVEKKVKEDLTLAIGLTDKPDGVIAQHNDASILMHNGFDQETAWEMAKLGASSKLTGIDTQHKTGGEAFMSTMRGAYYEEMKGTITTLAAFMGDPNLMEFANNYQKKIDANPVLESYGTWGDIGLSSIQPLASSLKFVGTQALLSWVPGGMAMSLGSAGLLKAAQVGSKVATGINFFTAGASQAGSVMYDLMQVEDVNGKKLPLNSNTGRLLFAGLVVGMGLVELASLSQLPGYSTMTKHFTQKEINKQLSTGLAAGIAQWGWESSKSTVAEATEEGVQYVLGIGFETVLKYMSNKKGGEFEFKTLANTFEEAKKQTWEAGKSMVLTSLLSGGLAQGAYFTRARHLSKENFTPSKTSVAVDSLFINTPKGTVEDKADRGGSDDITVQATTEEQKGTKEPKATTKEEKKTKKQEKAQVKKLEPVKVIRVADRLVPIDSVEMDKMIEAKARDAEVIEVEVKEDVPFQTESQTKMANQAAIATEGKIVNENTVAYETEDDLKYATFILSPNIEAVEKSGSGSKITLRNEDGTLSSLDLVLADENMETSDPDISFVEDPKAPYALSRMKEERAYQWHERQLVKESLGNVIEHTGGRINSADLEANVDAVILVANALNMPTDELLKNGVSFELVSGLNTTEGRAAHAKIEYKKDAKGNKVYQISLDKSANVGSLVHEVGHLLRGLASKDQLQSFVDHYGNGQTAIWLDDITETEGGKFELEGKEYNTFAEAAKLVNKNEERFANDFVTYMRTGKAPTKALQNIFNRMKAVLSKLVGTYGYKLDQETVRAFDQLFAESEIGVGPVDSLEDSTGVSSDTSAEAGATQLYEEANRQYDEVLSNYQGTDGWLKAPNGQATKLTEKQWVQVRTPSFLSWFGDWMNDSENASKVVDANGEPMVVYHGARSAGFSEFDNTLGDRLSDAPDRSSFFTSSRETAYSYTGDHSEPAYEGGDQASPGIYEVFLNIRDPGEFFFEGADWQGDLIGKVRITDIETDEVISSPNGTDYFDSMEEAEEYLNEKGLGEDKDVYVQKDPFVGQSTNSAATDAYEEGNDGAILRDVIDNGSQADPGPSDVYVTYDSSQIKSASSNNGEFAHVASILFEEAPPVDSAEFKEKFGDTKIVDGNGNPKIMYHGTSVNFDTFDKTMANPGGARGPGIYFTDERGMADYWASTFTDTPNIIQAYLSMKKPFYNSAYGEGQKNKSSIEKKAFKKILLDEFGLSSSNVDGLLNSSQPYSALSSSVAPKGENGKFNSSEGNTILNGIISRAGYDGIIAYYSGITEHIVFDNSQVGMIKDNSQEGNDPNILFEEEQDPVKYSAGQAPKKVGKGYKLFEMRDGKIYPLFITPKNSTPMNKWLVAEDNPTKTFAPRPGWHIGATTPDAPWLKGLDGTDEGTYRSRYKKGQRVWAEVEYSMDVDYQEEANNSKTKDLRGRIPEGGYYKFKEGQRGTWIISGAARVTKILSEAEVAKLLKDQGIKPSQTFNKYRNALLKKKATDARKKAEAQATVALYEEAQEQYDKVVSKYNDNGTDGWLKAPNGNPTNLTEKQWVQVRTPNFIEMFGDWVNDPGSIQEDALDLNGEPEVFYHGSSSDAIDIFELQANLGYYNNVNRGGFSFTNAKGAAEGYAQPEDIRVRSIQKYLTEVDEALQEAGIVDSMSLGEDEELDARSQKFYNLLKDDEAVGYFSEEKTLPDFRYVYWDQEDNPFNKGRKEWSQIIPKLIAKDFPVLAKRLRAASKGVQLRGVTTPKVYNVFLNIPKGTKTQDLTKSTLYLVGDYFDVRQEDTKAFVVRMENNEKVIYIAESNMVKSATNNNGLWDGTNPNILFEEAPLTIDWDLVGEDPETKVLDTKEKIAAHNTVVEIKEILFDNDMLTDDMLYNLSKLEDLLINETDIPRYFGIEEALRIIGDGRYETEIYEDHLLLDDEGEINEFLPNADVFDFAIQARGLTDDIYEAGYILPDGKMLDFSGKRDGGPAGVRNEDHRTLGIPVKEDLSGTELMVAFQKMGAVRIDASSGLIDLESRPTYAQNSVIKDLVIMNDEAYVDLQDGSRRSSFKAFSDPDRVVSMIMRFYNGQDISTNELFELAPPEGEARDAWFEGSEVVDMWGEPLPIYHGSAEPFTTFRSDLKGFNTKAVSAKLGWYFTADKAVAETYAVHSASKETQVLKEQLKIVEAKMREQGIIFNGPKTDYDNPLVIEQEALLDKWDDLDWEWTVNNTSAVMEGNLVMKKPMIVDRMGEGWNDNDYEKALTRAKDGGYDGVIFKNARDSMNSDKIASDQYIVFDDSQVGIIQYYSVDDNYETPVQFKDGVLYEQVENKKPLEQRVSESKLDEVYETIEDVRDAGGYVDDYGYVTVYHRTSQEAAKEIRITGVMVAKEDGLFFSTERDGQAIGFGEAVVKLEIPLEDLEMDDLFDKEVHFRLPLKRVLRKNISNYNPTVLFELAPPEESRAFKAWFGESKVVDDNGNPLVVYHGTDKEFSIFDANAKSKTGHPSAKLGFYFTSNKDVAEGFSKDNTSATFNFAKTDANIVKPFFLNIKNPKVISRIEFTNEIGVVSNPTEEYGFMRSPAGWESYKNELVNLGYDGVIISKDTKYSVTEEWKHDNYVAFSPNQIKSINNKGTWDNTNPNILFQEEVNNEVAMKMLANADELLSNLEERESTELSLTINSEMRERIKRQRISLRETLARIKSGAENNVARWANKNHTRIAVIHPYTKGEGYQYQVSFFDDKGPYGDRAIKSAEDINEALMDYNMTWPLAKEERLSLGYLLFQEASPLDSAEFKKWFGKSKVVDDQGNPLVIYHVTDQEFTKFSPSKSAMGGIFWFTSNKEKIDNNETGAGLRPNSKQRVIEGYLSIQNMAGWDEYEKLGLEQISARGYDGIKLDDTYIIFSPTQVKSINNKGLWDGTNPNILYEADGKPKLETDFPKRPRILIFDYMDKKDEYKKIWDTYEKDLKAWIDKAPDLMQFGTEDLVHVVHKNTIPGEGPWRGTSFSNRNGVWTPLGHRSYGTKYEAVKEEIEFKNYRPDILFEEAPLVDSAEFKALFANTKVVDKQGKPRKVFHGSFQDWQRSDTKFDPSLIGGSDAGDGGRGFYFADELIGAYMYTNGHEENIGEYYLDIRKPYDLEEGYQAEQDISFKARLRGEKTNTTPTIQKLLNFIEMNGFDIKALADRDGEYKSAYDVIRKLGSDIFTTILKKNGYDGVFYENEIVAFDSSQIYFAGKNNTLFEEAPPVDSKEFNTLFRKTQVVDRSGKPKIMYHGSNNQFDEFGKQRTAYGYFFTEDRNTAAYYGNKVYEVYLNSENSINLDEPKNLIKLIKEALGDEPYSPSAFGTYLSNYYEYEQLSELGSIWELDSEEEMQSKIDEALSQIEDTNNYDKIMMDYYLFKQGLGENGTNAFNGYGSQDFYSNYQDDIMHAAEGMGYDGVELTDPSSSGRSISFVVFKPDQVRFASNPNTLFEEAPPVGSAEFKALFANTKVVGKDGYPMSLYHGTGTAFSDFDESSQVSGKLGKGIYLTPNRNAANMFANIRSKNGTPIVMKLYANIEHPYTINGDANVPINTIDKVILQGKGYDGIILTNNGNITEVVAFSPSQVYQDTNALNGEASSDAQAQEDTSLFELSGEAKAWVLESRKKDVQTAVEYFYWISDEILNEYAGEEWADNEISFRSHLREFPWVLEEARGYTDTDEFLEFLQGSTEMADYQWTLEDEQWFKRIHAYSKIMSPELRDAQFVRLHTASHDKLFQLGNMLKGYQDVASVPRANSRKGPREFVTFKWGSFKGVSTHVKRLTKDSSDADFERAALLIQENPRPYRQAVQVVEQAEARVLEMKGLAHGTDASREAYYDSLGEDMQDIIGEPLKLNQMTDRETAEFLRTSDDPKAKYDARDKLATHDGVLALERQANAELKELGAEKDADLKKTNKKLQQTQENYKFVSVSFQEAKRELGRVKTELKVEKQRLEKLSDRLQKKSAQATKVNQLTKDLADRRARVKELRADLTVQNAEVRKLTKTKDSLQRRLDAKRTRQALEKLHKRILRTVTYNPGTIDASYEDAFNLLSDLMRQNQKVGELEALPQEMIQYIPPIYQGWIQRGRKIGKWSIESLEVLLEAAKLMRMDAMAILGQKQLSRTTRLQNLVLEMYKQTYGVMPEISPGYGSIMDDIISDMMTKQDQYEENIFKAMFATVKASIGKMQRISRVLDGNKEGVMYNLLVREAYAHMTEELRETYRRLEAADKMMKQLKITADSLTDKTFKFTTKAGQDRKLTKGEVIGVYVYSQNNLGMNKLIHDRGNKLSPMDVARAIGSLSDDEKAWGDFMIDTLGSDESWERQRDVFYNVYNQNLAKRERYFTFVADGKVGDEGKTDLLAGPQGTQIRYTDKDFTKMVNPHAIYPLKLDVTSTFGSQVKKQEHFVQWAEWTRDLNYLLTRGAIGNMIDMTHGPKFLTAVESYVREVGSPQTLMDDIERLGSKIVSNAAVAALSLNFLTMLKQLASFSAVVRGDVGALELLQVSMRLTNPKTHTEAIEFIHEMSPYMRKRAISVEVQRYNATDFNTYAGRKVSQFNDKIGMKGIYFMDQAAVNALWLASYDTYLRRNPMKLEGEALKKEAAFRATQLISETQPTSIITDLSSIQTKKNPWVRSALLFSNQMFQYVNMVWYDLPTAMKAFKATKDPVNLRTMFGIIGNMAISGALIMLVSGVAFRKDDEDDEAYWKRIMKEVLRTTASYTLPIVGNMVSQGASGYSSGSIVDLPSAFGRLLGTDWTDPDKISGRIWDLLDAGSSAVGLPTAFTNRAIKSITKENPLEMFGANYGDLWEKR